MVHTQHMLSTQRLPAQHSRLPFAHVVMSADEHHNTVFQAIRDGAEEYLVKPVTKKEVQNIWQYVWKRLSAAQLHVKVEPDMGFQRQSSASPDPPAASPNHQQQTAVQQLQQHVQQHAGPSSRAHHTAHAEQQQQQQQQHHAVAVGPGGSAAAPVQASTAKVSNKRTRTDKVLLSQWLQRPNRTVDPKESVWVFCEVLLLLERAREASGEAGLPAGLIRPNKLVLHASGRVSFAPSALAGVGPNGNGAGGAGDVTASSSSSLTQEQQLFQSPEEAEASVASQVGDNLANGNHADTCFAAVSDKSDVFSLGILFFDLFHCAPEGTRNKVLMDLRQRILPVVFLKQRPQEAAFALALLHPDPAARPSVGELVKGELLGGYCEMLRARHRQQEAVEQALDTQSLQYFLRTLQQRKQAEVSQVKGVIRDLDLHIEGVTSALSAVQQQVPAVDIKPSPAAAAPPPAATPSQQQQQQPVEAAQVGVASHGATHANGTDVEHVASKLADEDDDDIEEMRRERFGNKRRRVAANAGVAPAAAQAAPAAAATPAAPSNTDQANAAVPAAGSHSLPNGLGVKWGKVLDAFPELEAVFFKRKQQWDAQQQQQQQPVQRRSSPGISSSQQAAAVATAAPARPASPDSLPVFLQSFSDDLSAYTRYSKFVVRGALRASGDVLGGSAMVCGTAFDRDDEFFATAGVSKRIRIYEYARVVDGGCVPAVHYPLLEISSRSRLSCVAWSGYVKSHIASSDYEGVVQLWDANTNQELAQFEEHAKRAWSVDFSALDPSRLVSSSDDGTVRLWSINQECSVGVIDLKANVCSVQFSPDSPNLIAAGSADYKLHLYDLRNTSAPLAVAPGHAKAVSYVRFMNGHQLVSASTDNTLRLWNVPAIVSGSPDACELVFTGHTNEKNFIGLSVTSSGYIACGSETNQVFAYYKAMPMAVTNHHLNAGLGEGGTSRALEAMAEFAEGPNQFVSSVCWSKRHGTLLVANSAGHIKVLELV
eukprot:jgi/Chrzof1/10598/Cz05g04250.t1